MGGGQGRASQTKGSCFCHMPHPPVPAPLARCLDQTEAHMLVYVPSSRVLPPDNRRVCVCIYIYLCVCVCVHVCVVNNSQSFLPSAALSLCQTMPGMVRNVFEPSSPRVAQEFHQPKTAMVQPKGVARGGGGRVRDAVLHLVHSGHHQSASNNALWWQLHSQSYDSNSRALACFEGRK